MSSRPEVLVLACGALARELTDLFHREAFDNVTLDCLPASYHNDPSKIPDAVRNRVAHHGDRFDRILVGYADCGTGGRLDRVCEELGLERLPGAHCYQFFAGADTFGQMHDDQPGTFYLTDYLVKHFDRLVWTMLGLDRHPQLRDDYFGNYTRVMYLAQTDDEALRDRAATAAARLGLPLETHLTGYGEMADSVVEFVGRPPLVNP